MASKVNDFIVKYPYYREVIKEYQKKEPKWKYIKIDFDAYYYDLTKEDEKHLLERTDFDFPI